MNRRKKHSLEKAERQHQKGAAEQLNESIYDKSGKLKSAKELRKEGQLKHGGQPDKNQNYRVHPRKGDNS
jgi:hypothetical protein